MWYRSKTARVRCPEIAIATRSGTPARIMLRMAVLRRSRKIFPSTCARLAAPSQDLRKSPNNTTSGSWGDRRHARNFGHTADMVRPAQVAWTPRKLLFAWCEILRSSMASSSLPFSTPVGSHYVPLSWLISLRLSTPNSDSASACTGDRESPY
jgi:hypothetical protein